MKFTLFCKTKMIKNFIEYSEYVRWLSPITIKNYRWSIVQVSKYFCSIWKDINDPKCITLEDVNNFVIKMRMKWLTWRSCNTRLNLIRRYLSYCRDIKDIDCLNPKKIVSSKVEDRRLWYHNDEKKKLILDLVNKWYWRTSETIRRNKLMVYLLFHTWLRVWELNLKVSDIDQTTQIIWKGRRHRFTYLSPEIMNMINDYLKHRSYKWEYLFNTMYKWKIHKLCIWTIERIFHRMWEKLGFRVNPHSFRHTFATDLLKIPWCNIFDVATLMWHKDISTTAVYLGVDSKHLMDIQFSIKI